MAAAAAAAALIVAKATNLMRADKQLDTSYRSIEKLKDVGYHKFYAQLSRIAYAYVWDNAIWDLAVVALTLAQITADIALDTADSHKRGLDRRNAYLLVMYATDGHTVENLIEALAPGDPRLLLDTIHRFFHPNTTAGLQTAYLDLFQGSMSTTGTTISSWISHVSRAAKVVRTSGGNADNSAELAVLLRGLLPEFAQIRTYLNQRPALTLPDAIAALMDFARQENILELSKGAMSKQGKGNIYLAETKAEEGDKPDDRAHKNKKRTAEYRASIKDEECNNWKLGRCMFGKDCYRKHVGKEGAEKKEKVPSSPPLIDRLPEPTTTVNLGHAILPVDGCMLCHQGTQHHPSKCPIASNQHCADYVFAAEAVPEIPREVSNIFQAKSHQNPSRFGKFVGLFFVTVLLASIVNTMTSSFEYARVTISEIRNVSVCTVLLVICFAMAHKVQSAPQPGYARAYIVGQDDASPSGGLEWCADTGCNRFITNDINDFIPSSITDINLTVGVGNGTYIVKKQGDIIVENHLGKIIKCSNALYMPKCGKKLMPASPFMRAGCKLTISLGQIDIYAPDHSILLSGTEINGLYYFKAKTVPPAKFLNRSTQAPDSSPPTIDGAAPPSNYFGLPFGRVIAETGNDFAKKLLETHFAFGHLNFPKLRKFLGLKQGDNPHCPACAIAMSRQAPLRKATERSTRVNHRLHIDIGFTSGSLNPFQLCVDDFTRVSHLDLLVGKDEVLPKFVDLKKLLDNQHAPWKLAFVRSDNEFVYTSNKWIEYCREEGIEHEFPPPYRHDALGVVERAMQTVGVAFRTQMLQGNAPVFCIPYGLNHSNIVRNHCPSKANGGLTPLEKQAGMKLPINKRLLQGVLFCLVYIHIYSEERAKHGPRAVACVYLGFDATNNQFIAMEWVTGKIHYCGDGNFICNVFPFRANPHAVPSWMLETDFLTPSCAVSQPHPVPHSLPAGPRRSYRQHSDVYADPAPNMVPLALEGERRASDRQRAYRYTLNDQGVQVAIDSIPDAVVLLAYIFSPHLYNVHDWGPEPTTWAEAMAGPYADRWILAMLEERESFRQRQVYTLVPRSQANGSRIFKSRPVLKFKFNPPTPDQPNGSLAKFKYRLTIAAFTSMLIQGVDYKEKFASTVRWAATKLIIAQAVLEDLDLLHIDIKTFFLYGVLDEGKPVFMEQPEGWEALETPRDKFVCLLDKSMYGHPAASHCAQKVLKEVLTANDSFRPTTADDCVFVSNEKLPFFAVGGTHVDDILATGDQGGLLHFVDTLEKKFEITTKLNPLIITGVQIVRDRKLRFLKLHQGEYVRDLLIQFKMQDCEAVDTPIDPATARALMMLPIDSPDPVAIDKFQSLVGCLLWLLKTRHDIAFATNLLARFTRVATQAHLTLSMRVLRYLKGHIEYGIIFLAGFEEDGVLSGEADADFAGDLISSRSTSGGYLKIGRLGTINCRSSLEKKISTSTGQAETYALASTIKDVVWTRHLANDIRRAQVRPTELNTDNQGVHLQSSKAINHATAKHFRVSQAYIREMGSNGSIHVNKVGTSDNHADFLTKALCADLFQKHRDAIMGPVKLQLHVPSAP